MKIPRQVLFSTLALMAASLLVGLAVAADGTRGPATSLKHPTSAETAPDADGFIPRWLLLEPIPVSGQLTEGPPSRATINADYFPNQLTVMPHDGDKVTVKGSELTWNAVDTTLYNVNLYHFAYAHNKPTSNVLFWGITVINCPEDMPDVRLAIGSNASSVWWVNGREVIGIFGDIQTTQDDGVSKRLTLKKGPNVVRFALINGNGATDFCARFLDANGKPLKRITASLPAAGK